MTYTTIAIIYNPNSTGSSKQLAKEFADKVQQQLPKQKIELVATTHAGHAEELAYTLSKKSKRPLIISSSGDGGYNEVVNGALKAQEEGHHPTTGLLPAGNANDHFNNLHNDDLVDLIVDGISKKIDVLKLTYTADSKENVRYAHSYIGLGLTSVVGNELNKKKLNLLNEVWIVASALLKVRSIKLKIGKKAHHYYSVVFSNVDQMSKYLKISKPSRVTDGKFEVTIFRRSSKLKLILLLLKASVVNLKEDARVSSFTLQTIKPTLVQADGEIFTVDAHSRVTVTAEKQLLNCIV